MAGLDTVVSQGLALSPEAKQILGQELSLFSENFLPNQRQEFGDILRRLGSGQPATNATQGLQATNQLAQTATATAGQQFGLPGREQGNIRTNLFENEEDLMKALQALFEHIGTTQQSLIDPRFAQFLRPRVDTDQDGPGLAESVLPLVAAGIGTAGRFVA